MPADPLAIAPDGSEVRPLARVADGRGSLGHFTLAAGTTSKAVRHYFLDEIWFVVDGTGEMWREGAEPVAMAPGVAMTIPAGVAFQFRADEHPLRAVGLTLPAWPLERPEEEVVDTDVRGRWPF
jgi:mannose-6-phosphate isomerase-like protein (cupin superfamily)